MKLIHILISVFAFFKINLCDQLISQLSKLNTIELNNYRYQIEIKDPIEENDNRHISDPNFMRLKSIYGQTFECHLPTLNIEDQEDEIPSKNKKKSINFTLVNETLRSYLKKLNDSKYCIYKVVFFFLLSDLKRFYKLLNL
jgi:hypothetical protein